MGLLKYKIVPLVLCLCFVFGNGRIVIWEHEGSGSDEYRDDEHDALDDDDTTSVFERTTTKYDDYEPPSCFPPCQNNGICIEPGVCQCPEKVEGKQCQFNYNSKCESIDEDYENIPYLYDQKHYRASCYGMDEEICYMFCEFGYQIPGHPYLVHKILTCVNQKWHIKLNDGNLILPYCEAEGYVPKVKVEEEDIKREPDDTTISTTFSTPLPITEREEEEYNSQCINSEPGGNFDFVCSDENGQHSCSITCYPGYQIPRTQQSIRKELSCVRGIWYMESDDGNLIDPSCEVDPFFSYFTNMWITSQTEEVTENYSRSSNECQEEPPMSQNANLIRLISDSTQEYKVECMQGYIFPDSTKEQYLECVDGKWYHKQSGNSKAPDCGLCPGEQIFAEAEDCMITCTDLANYNTCQNNIVQCRCPYGEYLNDKDQCVPAKNCPCLYDGSTFEPGYKQKQAGEKFLELCTCEDANWNCSSALEEDLQKYPPASDLDIRCAQNPNSCKIKTSTECSEKSSYDVNNYGFINNLLNKLTHSVDLSSQNKLKEITKDSESSWENADEPNIKVMSLNLQSMEIRGGSRKHKEKTIQICTNMICNYIYPKSK